MEDDPSIASSLSDSLESGGYTVVHVATGQAAIDADYGDVVLLDLGLPDMDGYDVCRAIRAESNVPIIVITARGEEFDRVLGLELGADDYVVKPFGYRELVARDPRRHPASRRRCRTIRARQRRRHRGRAVAHRPPHVPGHPQLRRSRRR